MSEAFNSPLQGALDFAARGLFILPITAGKKAPPHVSDWEANASSDPAQIEKWNFQCPDCNFGCAPHRSGHLVIDLDQKNGRDGVAQLERLTHENYFALPEQTLTVKTPNGFHIYLSGTAQSSANRIAPGVDIRSRGGYVLCPGSIVDGKQYRIVSDLEPWDVIPDAPSKLLELAAKLQHKETPQPALGGVPFTPAQLTEMLCYLDPDCSRDEWRDIAAALHAAPCTDPKFDKRELFVRWSRGEVSR